MVMALQKAKSSMEGGECSDTCQHLKDVVQTSLIGSIFSNSLLVLGCAFVANGIKWKESSFNIAFSYIQKIVLYSFLYILFVYVLFFITI